MCPNFVYDFGFASEFTRLLTIPGCATMEPNRKRKLSRCNDSTRSTDNGVAVEDDGDTPSAKRQRATAQADVGCNAVEVEMTPTEEHIAVRRCYQEVHNTLASGASPWMHYVCAVEAGNDTTPVDAVASVEMETNLTAIWAHQIQAVSSSLYSRTTRSSFKVTIVSYHRVSEVSLRRSCSERLP